MFSFFEVSFVSLWNILVSGLEKGERCFYDFYDGGFNTGDSWRGEVD